MVKTGIAFPDYISREKGRKRRNFEFKERETRDIFLIVCLVLLVSIVLIKLFFLQIVDGKNFRVLSDSNRIKTIVIHAPRGAIFDRNGQSLVYNTPGFRKSVNGKTVLLTKKEALNALAKGETDIEYDSFRYYPYSQAFAHVLGYIGEISEEELKDPNFATYKPGDLIGKMGVEQAFESLLKGDDGKQLVEVDSVGRTIRKLGQTDPIPGQNITLNLDLNLQKTSFDAMKDVQKGAVVVSNPKGEILAMISKPSFDPNIFTQPQASNSSQINKEIQNIVFDTTGKSLLNRAISGTYPPGSTFKLVVASAGLQDNVIDQNWEVQDNGIITVGDFSFSNWYFTQYGKTEGPVNIVKGIKRSNDIFFYTLAQKVGVDRISEFAKKFGLGSPLGIDIAGEAAGLVPTQEWKKQVIGEQWYLGDTYHYGIGQGYLLTTPLQVNGWTQAIANSGTLYQPHILKGDDKILNKNFLSSNTVNLIREGMIESCSTGGVAWPLFEFKIKNSKLRIDGKNFLPVPEATTSANFKDYRKVTVACKTGTAQHGTETTLPHAWITLFAPAYNPQIVVTVLAEESGEGSNVAAPIAKKILEDWFTR